MTAENTVGLRSNPSEIKEFTYKYHAMEECVRNWKASSTNKPGQIIVQWAPVNDGANLDKYGITVTLIFLWHTHTARDRGGDRYGEED